MLAGFQNIPYVHHLAFHLSNALTVPEGTYLFENAVTLVSSLRSVDKLIMIIKNKINK
jgi:hypothetical protein